MESEEILQVRSDIKKWEYAFKEKNDRPPSKSDIKANVTIRSLYQKYKVLKSGGNPNKHIKRESSKTSGSSSFKDQASPFRDEKNQVVEIKISSDTEDSNDKSDHQNNNKSTNIENTSIIPFSELGPTPQANGKVLSIFDVRLTPPESSPLKSKSGTTANQSVHTSTNDIPFVEFRTPTRAKKLDLARTPTTASKRKESVFSKLRSLSEQDKMPSEADQNDHRRLQDTTNIPTEMETPRYLGRHNKKFELANPSTSHHNLPSSPFNIEVSPSKTPMEVTPVRNSVVDFSVSPSPLKPHRFISRRLSDVFNEIKAIEQSDISTGIDSIIEDINEDEEEEEGDLDPTTRPYKKRHIKRTTRNWKMKPVSEDADKDRIGKKDIHIEIKKMEEKERGTLNSYITSDVESEEDDKPLKAKHVPGVKQVKPVRMNYQRLKINDPRSKAFKRRGNFRR
ncbi:DNA replication/checkpoint protein [Scheffersomyces xylosifermentans]|uniref:DNA replication/checkpoint protein n=1 Tax=Scheffersomyces xylosifermentans TaxID=1304137 RepID=UPI00315DC385